MPVPQRPPTPRLACWNPLEGARACLPLVFRPPASVCLRQPAFTEQSLKEIVVQGTKGRVGRQQVVVVEINEIPVKVLSRYAASRPDSCIAEIMAGSKVLRTVADDVDPDVLYPSQTWASMNTGLPYMQHHIHWYNDPKPDEPTFYWHRIADSGASVGVVNTLHSSPMAKYLGHGDFKFIVPDCFAIDDDAFPAKFRDFQRFNLALTRANSRKSSLQSALKQGIAAALRPTRIGLTPRSAQTIASTLLAIARGKASKERIRILQFPLVAEIFLSQTREHDPDLAVLFTNHVAANQHRYWYAAFPDEYSDAIYPDDWAERYRGELNSALDLLDRYLRQIKAFSDQTNRIIVLCSSMGQQANERLTKDKIDRASCDYRLDDAAKVVRILLGNDRGVSIAAGMVPQYSLLFETPGQAREFVAVSERAMQRSSGIDLVTDLNDTVITMTFKLDPTADTFVLGGRDYTYDDLGFTRFDVDDHHSGRHHPEGSLVIYNDDDDLLFPADRFKPDQPFSYLEYAPEMVRYFTAGAVAAGTGSELSDGERMAADVGRVP